ncbi:MAG TPA: UvrD-helicase domain-containing protein, partial [Kofleriaceae bacterium]|nr:UvrD-helicase domain-containing protein [Kofleriaceae bacterium]
MADPRYPIPPVLAGLDRGRHQVIEASAGTGKTFLIEHCVVDLVIAGAATIDQIAVVTFTEKATAELRRRVRRVLEAALAGGRTAADGEPAWTVDAEARARLAAALTSFDRAQISTIHALCQRILTENAFASRRLFAQTQVASELAFMAAFRAQVRERFACDAEEATWLQAWLDSGDGRTIADLGRRLHRCSELGGRITPTCDPARIAAAMDRLAAAPPDLAAVELALRRAKLRSNSVDKLVDRLQLLAPTIAAWPEHRRPARVLVDFERAAHPLGDLKDLIDKRLPELAALTDALAELLAAVAPLEAAVVQRFLPAVGARARRDKDRLGQFDFRDMLELVWAALEAPGGAELAARLRGRWRCALIDEFQDTDDVQWRIFRRVWAEGDGRLYIIGDPKQAIYGFRAADVHTYLDARDQLLALGAQRSALVDSWRSTADLVAAANDLFVDDGDHSLFAPAGRVRCPDPLRAAAGVIAVDAEGRPVVPVDLMALPTDPVPSADAAREALVGFVADEIG